MAVRTSYLMHPVCSKNKLLCKIKHMHHSSSYFGLHEFICTLLLWKCNSVQHHYLKIQVMFWKLHLMFCQNHTFSWSNNGIKKHNRILTLVGLKVNFTTTTFSTINNNATFFCHLGFETTKTCKHFSTQMHIRT